VRWPRCWNTRQKNKRLREKIVATNGNELVSLCREHAKGIEGAEAILDDLVVCLTHEHELRQLLHVLPITDHLHFNYSRVLFASFFYGFMNYPAVVKNTTVQEKLKKAKFEFNDEGLSVYVQLMEELLEPVKKGFAATEKKQPPKDVAKRKVFEKVRRKSLVFRERLKEYTACVRVEADTLTANLAAANREVVDDWYDCLDAEVDISSKVIAVLKKQLEKLPYELTEQSLEKVENLLVTKAFSVLKIEEKTRLIQLLGVLMVDEDAFWNFHWLLTDNALCVKEQWADHARFIAELDLIRCFHTQSVDVLNRFVSVVSQVDEDKRDPFFKLLDLKVLNQAAELAVNKLKKSASK